MKNIYPLSSQRDAARTFLALLTHHQVFLDQSQFLDPLRFLAATPERPSRIDLLMDSAYLLRIGKAPVVDFETYFEVLEHLVTSPAIPWGLIANAFIQFDKACCGGKLGAEDRLKQIAVVTMLAKEP